MYVCVCWGKLIDLLLILGGRQLLPGGLNTPDFAGVLFDGAI